MMNNVSFVFFDDAHSMTLVGLFLTFLRVIPISETSELVAMALSGKSCLPLIRKLLMTFGYVISHFC